MKKYFGKLKKDLDEQERKLLQRVEKRRGHRYTNEDREELDVISSKRLSLRIDSMIIWWMKDSSSPDDVPSEGIKADAKVDLENVSGDLKKDGFKRFTMWVNLSESEKKNVESVTYFMKNRSFPRPVLVGVPGTERKFEVSYIDYEALKNVIITIQNQDGTRVVIEFDQYKATYDKN